MKACIRYVIPVKVTMFNERNRRHSTIAIGKLDE